MKKFLVLFGASFICLMFGFIYSCEGPMGPAGPQGEQGEIGAQGTQGIQGLTGAEGTAGCITCHTDSTYVFSRQIQASNSIHKTGGNFERNANDCAPCHTHEGFVETQATGADTTLADISNPSPVNCRTCHQIHETFTIADFALTTTSSVTARVFGSTIDIGKGNLCVNCHQNRGSYLVDYPVTLTSTDSIALGSTSKRFGPHHGGQGSMFAGVGGFDLTGSVSYANSSHTTMITNACVTCHMAEAFGGQAGGHTFNITYLYHGGTEYNFAGCTACHSDEEALETKIEDTEAVIETLLADIKTLLEMEGVLVAGYAATGVKLHPDALRAYWNYKFVEEDRSNGAHNFKYAKALLTNSKEALEAL